MLENLMIKIYDSLRVFGSSSPLAFIFFFWGPQCVCIGEENFLLVCDFFPFDEISAFILFNLNFHLQAKNSIIPFLLDERLMEFTFHGVVEQISINSTDLDWDKTIEIFFSSWNCTKNFFFYVSLTHIFRLQRRKMYK